MRYVSIDIETTGLDDREDLILQFAAVIDSSTKPEVPIEELPSFMRILRHSRIVGDPFALSMHATLLRRIANNADSEIIRPVHLPRDFAAWLCDNGYESSAPVRFIAAGKNFAGFDKQFLRQLPDYEQYVRPHHRSLDPAMLWFDPFSDTEPPSLDTCLYRAGLEGSVQHDALSDARDVIRVLRAGWVTNRGRWRT